MQWVWKALAMGVALATTLSASPVFAAQNVANTSQKGSLLIFPQIDVRPDRNTIVRIANDANKPVDIKCYYVNERKGRNDFQLRLTKKQPVVWDALTGSGDPENVNPFPVNEDRLPAGATLPGDKRVGELLCFAVDEGGETQISWNHLSGTATVYDASAGTVYAYSAFSFAARNGIAGQPHGSPGRLDLTGSPVPGGTQDYDACPAYNIVHFAPVGSSNSVATYRDTEVAVSSCNQDLRQDFVFHFTKIPLPVWNTHEVKFTGAHVCVDSTSHFWLSTLLGPGFSSGAGNTSYDILRTHAAHLQMSGVKSTVCPFATENTGLLVIAVSYAELFDPSGGSSVVAAAATNAITAGVSAVRGVVRWDPADGTPEKR